jgi:Domain of unknown function (DUF4157)
MADSPSTAIPEAAKATSTTHPPVQDRNVAAEMESDRSSMLGERTVRAIGGGSPEAQPERFAGVLGQISGASQVGMIRQLQRSYGNSYVGSVIQAKLTVGQPGDVFEQEADQIADQVMRMPDLSSSNHELSFSSVHASTAQRKCMACEEEEEKLQRKENGSTAGNPATIPPVVHEVLSSPGQPLDPVTRAFMEPRFGQDFSQVRVRTDAAAAQSAREVNANAYTVGHNIVFGAGRFAPGTDEGQRLIAHELTHVVQQSGGDEIHPRLIPGKRDPSFGGQQAAEIAVEGGQQIPIRSATTSASALQRDAADDLADYGAHELDDYVAKNPSPYKHVIEVIHFWKARELDDNVAAAFTKLQSPAKLEDFAADKDKNGLAMLDVLYEAMITGSVTLFESLQAERILIAKAKTKSIGTEQYVAEAERIAELRHKASPAFSEDQKVSQIAEDLNVYVANNLYAHVIEVIHFWKARELDDNVAAAFVEQQSDAKLEDFAADKDKDGLTMLDVLYEAMITGDVSSFESLQAERILIAKAKQVTPEQKGIPPEQYVAEAERIANLRDVAEDTVEELVVDLVAAKTAHELNDDVAKQRYGDVIKKIQDLSANTVFDAGHEDNVASHFIELQTPARLEEFAVDDEGRAMLNVLYAAIITGDVTPFERLQAKRILEAKAKRSPRVPDEQQYLEQLKEERQYILPLRKQKLVSRFQYAIFTATLQPNGKVKVSYPGSVFWDSPMFKEDRKNLPAEYEGGKSGFELNPDQLVFLKLYDQQETLKPVRAIELIDYANDAQREVVSGAVKVFEVGLTLGFGGLGAFSGARAGTLAAEVELGEASVAALSLEKAVLWADRVAMALPVVSMVVNENRDWILEKFPNAGPVLLGVLDQANRLAEYYGWAQMTIDGARYLKSKLEPAVAAWRAEKATARELSSSQRKAFEGIDGAFENIQNDLSKAEIEAGNEAVKYVEEHPGVTEGKPGERSAPVDEQGKHHVKEVKEPGTGAVHCEYQSEPIEVPCPAPWTQEPQEEPKAKTGSDPKATEPKPTEPPIAAAPAVPLSPKEQTLQVLGDNLEKAKTQLNAAGQELKNLEKQGKDRSTPEHKAQQEKLTEALNDYVNARNLMEAERRAQGITPRQIYEHLRDRTPNAQMYRVAATKPSPYGPGVSPDHIIPVIDVAEIPGMERLPPNMQTEVANIPENTIGVDQRINSSKKDKLWSAEPGTSRYWEGHPDFGPIPDEVRRAMAQAEVQVRAALEKAVKDRLDKLGL